MWSIKMKILTENKQLLYLFLCSFAIFFIGFGLFPILPLYAAEFGARSSFIGIYLAITYIAISVGSALAGQLSERLTRRRLYIISGVMGTPALFLLGHAHELWQVVVLTALVWFTGGIGISISNVLTSLHTTSATRGKAFGMLALASPLAALIGGSIVGGLVEWKGYPLMFTVLTLVWMAWPALAITRVEDKPDCAPVPGTLPQPSAASPRPGPVFLLLLLTVLLASMTVSVGRMGLSLAMKSQQFSVGDISIANALGGLATIPVTLLVGVFSDKLGRKRFLALGYLVAMGSAVMLISARELWQFWVVSALVLASRNMIASMSPAYAADLLRRRFLGKALPLVGAMNWISGVIGFAGAGYMLDTFGAAGLYGVAALTAFSGAVIVAFMPTSLRAQPSAPVSKTKGSLQTAGD
jgi:MFS family permease